MSVIKCRGIVISEQVSGESDKTLMLLTKEFGKIRVNARGARKPKSKYMAGAQLFTYSDFVLYGGKNFYAVTQIDIIESFHHIKADYDRLCFGTYIMELAHKTIFEDSPNDFVMRLILKALSVLNAGRMPPNMAARIFEFKYLQLSGYQPETERCVSCGGEIGALPSGAQVLFGMEGLICSDCAYSGAHGVKIGYPALYAISYIMASEIKDVFHFTITEAVYRDLAKAADVFMTNLDVEIKSREMLAEY